MTSIHRIFSHKSNLILIVSYLGLKHNKHAWKAKTVYSYVFYGYYRKMSKNENRKNYLQ